MSVWTSDDLLVDVEAEITTRLGLEGSGLPSLILRQVNAGGKRMRPRLALRAVEAFTGPLSDRAVRAAAAVEMVHVGSLIHDDVMDGARSRRGVETINSSHGDQYAIVAGDLILGLAGECAIAVSAEVGTAISRSLVDLAVGQQLENETLYDGSRNEAVYYASIRGKTGSLLSTAARIGALAEGLDPAILRALGDFGMEFGIAFQIIDDLLDIVSTEAAYAKPVHNDYVAGVANFPTILAWQADEFASYRAPFEDATLPVAERVGLSDELALLLASSRHAAEAELRARHHATLARDAILAAGLDSERTAQLADLPLEYVDQQLRNLDSRGEYSR